jgi:hypothetical protein
MKLRTFIFIATLTATAAAQSAMAPIQAARRAADASAARTAESTRELNAHNQATTPVSPVKANAAQAVAKTSAVATPSARPSTAATKPITPTTNGKPALPRPAVTAVKAVPATAPKTPSKAAKAVAKPAPTSAKTTAPVVAQVQASEEAGKPAAKPAPEMASRKDRRDPFVSIIRSDRVGGVQCASGKKCLVIGDIVLRGIVKSQEAVIAVVESPQKKTYFLRENDPVFMGEVVKITSDSIVFREQITDRAGRVSTREITKRLNERPIA